MTETRRRRARRLFAVAALACAALPTAPALASPDQQSLIEDEKLMLESGPAVQASSLDEAKALGADVIRANVIWSRYAPSPTSTKKPKGFDGKNPTAYAPRRLRDAGLVRGRRPGARHERAADADRPDPRVGVRLQGLGEGALTCKPNAQLFGAFVRALGTRYPTVKAWSVWNEPNLRAWLTPQYEVSGGQAIQRSAYMYRPLATSAIAGLRATGHTTKTDQIWIGETAPLGDDPSGCSAQKKLRAPSKCAKSITKTSPSTFLRGVFCLSTSGGSLTGTEGKDQHCSGYKKLAVNGYAHHPYTRGGSQPPLAKTNSGEITISVASRLTKLLDQAAKRKRIPSKLPINYTEHGWQTNPPGVHDAFAVTDAQQAEYINQSDWIAYQNARVHTVAQYKIVDDESIGAGFQMGLRLFSGGARKPSYDAYKLPIWVAPKGSNVTVYGQARPADPGAAGNVEVQNATSAGGGVQDGRHRSGDLAQRHLHHRPAELRRRLAVALERAHLAHRRRSK